jgi:hypothetical protein
MSGGARAITAPAYQAWRRRQTDRSPLQRAAHRPLPRLPSERRQPPNDVRHLLRLHSGSQSSNRPEKRLHSGIIDLGTVRRASGCFRQPAACSGSNDCIELTMLRLYDCKDVLKVASPHDSPVQLNLDPRRPATDSAMVVPRGWAEPLPELASCTPLWSPGDSDPAG